MGLLQELSIYCGWKTRAAGTGFRPFSAALCDHPSLLIDISRLENAGTEASFRPHAKGFRAPLRCHAIGTGLDGWAVLV